MLFQRVAAHAAIVLPLLTLIACVAAPLAPTPAPTNSPTPPADTRPLIPISAHADAFTGAENDCVAQQPEAVRALATRRHTDRTRRHIYSCLEPDSALRLYLDPILAFTGDLDIHETHCIRQGFQHVDIPAQASTSFSQAARAASYTYALGCLSTDTWQLIPTTTISWLGLIPGGLPTAQCYRQSAGPQGLAAITNATNTIRAYERHTIYSANCPIQ